MKFYGIRCPGASSWVIQPTKMKSLLLFTALLLHFCASAQRIADVPISPNSIGNVINKNEHYGHGCADDAARTHIMGRYPHLLHKESAMNEAIRNARGLRGQQRGADLYISVVVHVIYGTEEGPENISDELVMQGISDLNDAFANTGAYASEDGVDTHIRFCLALQDPLGLPSNGITRNQSAYTNMFMESEDLVVKSISTWDQTSYLNIWLVAGINSTALGSGVAGYAYLPYSHGLPEDGIVNEASWFGSSSDNSKVHIHEVGHYLGLYHTFQNGCANLDCTLDGDLVCDTPPDGSTGASPCGLTQNSCSSDEDDTSANNPFRPVLLGGLGDQNDLIENYMDYSSQACQTLFTAGQSERMNAALENERASLLSSGGCVSSCGIGPVEINDELDIFLAGTSFSLTQNTLAIVDVDFQWTFNGEIISTDSTLNYTFTNAQIGDGYLVLNVINTELDCSRSDSLLIHVKCNPPASYTMSPQYLEVNDVAVFDATNPLNTSYQWYLDGVLVGTNPVLTYQFDTAEGHHLFLVTGNGQCNDTSAVDYFAVGSCEGGQNNHWIFGGVHVDFSSGEPTSTAIPSNEDNYITTIEGISTISDQNGELLFYCDGNRLFNKNYEVFYDYPAAGPSSAQGALIVPDPGNSSEYYVFMLENFGGYITGSNYDTNWGFGYVKVDMNMNGGLGGVSEVSDQLLEHPYEAQCAIRHCNGHDIWVVTRAYYGNSFYSYLITDEGVSEPVISDVGFFIDDLTGYYGLGNMKASPQGNVVAITGVYMGIRLFGFDTNSGAFTDDFAQLNSALYTPAYGLAFSPDGSKLYYGSESTPYIYQCDLSSGNQQLMINSIMSIATTATQFQKGSMELGPDGKIYSIQETYQNYLDVIANPNEPGLACNFLSGEIELAGYTSYGIQNTLSSAFANSGPQIAGLSQICNNNFDVHYTVACGNNVWTYQGNNTFNEISSTEVSIDFTVAGVDTLMCTSTTACSGTKIDTLLIHVGIPDLFLGNDTAICSSGSITLNAYGQFTDYTWSNNAYGPFSTVSTTGNYWVAATAVGGCIARDTIHVAIFNEPFDVPGDTVVICGEYNNWFYLEAQQGDFTHNWFSANGPVADELPIYLYVDYAPYNFPIYYTNANGCVDVETLVVQVRPPLPDPFLGEDIVLCNDEVATISIDESSCPYCLYTWQDGSHDNPYTVYESPFYQYGSYSVIRYDSLCNSSTIDFLTVSAPSQDYLVLEDSITICEGSEIQLYAGFYFDNFEWQDGSTDYFYMATEPGTYWVKTVTECGVFSDTTHLIVIDSAPYQIELPDTIYACSAALPVQVSVTNTNLYGYGWSNGSGFVYEEGPLYVTGYYICGTTSDSTYIHVTPSPVDLIPPSIHVCDSTIAWLTQPENQFTTWEGGIVGDSILVSEEGLYHYTTSIGNECTISDSVSVFFNTLYFDVSDTSICPGDSIVITPDTNAEYWFWYFNGQSFEGQIEVADTGLYWVFATDYFCNRSFQFDVILQNGTAYELTLPDFLSACETALPLPLTAAGDPALQYSWSNGSNSPTTQMNNEGWYILQANYQCGQRSDSTFLSVLESPIMLIPSDTILCANQEIILSASDQYSNAWSTGETTNDIVVNEAGEYTLISISDNGCINSATTQVVESSLFVNLDDVLYNCANDTLLIQASTNGTDYLWSNGGNSISTTLVGGGSLSFTSTLENCSETEIINIIQYPFAAFSLGNDTLLTSTSFTITAPDGFSTYNWNVPGENGSTLTVNSTGTYSVTVTDENGCQFTDYITVVFNVTSTESFIEVPDFFFYGNNGLVANYQNVEVYDIKIFDDIGRLVQYGNTFPMVWDGGTINGNAAASAMYFYVINYSDLYGNKKVKTGNVLLLK
jgi:hypothetical protein